MKRLERLADLVLKTGAGLERGQKVLIQAELAHRDQVLVFTKRAYELGASFVYVDWREPRLNRIRFDNAQDALDYLPDFMQTFWDELARDRWVSISFTGKDEPFLMDGVDPIRQSLAAKARSEKRANFHHHLLRKDFPWVVVPAPTEGWAAAVLDREPSEETLDEFWDIMEPILKLDQPDPAKAWKDQALRLQNLAEKTTSFHFDTLHFQGPGTDFEVGLSQKSRWVAGADRTSYGKEVMVNLPTEEVFTTPDWRRTKGRVTCSRPVEVLGSMVAGAWFVFEDGRVKEWGAESNKSALDAFLSQDPQAAFLGEIALVDVESPIYKSGLVFREILLDENAACHFALGAGYPDGMEGTLESTYQELLALGCNVSPVHLDFMIGCPEMSVTGLTPSGSRVIILEKGRFVL